MIPQVLIKPMRCTRTACHISTSKRVPFNQILSYHVFFIPSIEAWEIRINYNYFGYSFLSMTVKINLRLHWNMIDVSAHLSNQKFCWNILLTLSQFKNLKIVSKSVMICQPVVKIFYWNLKKNISHGITHAQTTIDWFENATQARMKTKS